MNPRPAWVENFEEPDVVPFDYSPISLAQLETGRYRPGLAMPGEPVACPAQHRASRHRLVVAGSGGPLIANRQLRMRILTVTACLVVLNASILLSSPSVAADAEIGRELPYTHLLIEPIFDWRNIREDFDPHKNVAVVVVDITKVPISPLDVKTNAYLQFEILDGFKVDEMKMNHKDLYDALELAKRPSASRLLFVTAGSASRAGQGESGVHSEEMIHDTLRKLSIGRTANGHPVDLNKLIVARASERKACGPRCKGLIQKSVPDYYAVNYGSRNTLKGRALNAFEATRLKEMIQARIEMMDEADIARKRKGKDELRLPTSPFAPYNQQGDPETVVNRLIESATPPPGGIDFSSLELRYLANIDVGQGSRYALQAKVSTDGQNSGSGSEAARQASDAFFVWLALPPSSFIVNLNPTEPDDILNPQFARTDAGRILLEADLRLKKSTAALIHPHTDLGRQFWDALEYGSGSRTCFSLRTWIQPGKAEVRATENELYIVDAPLSVQTEAHYVQQAGRPNLGVSCPKRDERIERHNEALFRKMILPRLAEAVNQGDEYQDLRQVYLSRVAAQWVRDRSAHRITAYSDIIDSGNIDKWPASQPWDPQAIYRQYVKSFTEGEYNATWDVPLAGGRLIETRFGSYGGIDFSAAPTVEVGGEAFQREWSHLPAAVRRSLSEITPDINSQRVWLGGMATPLSRDAAGLAPWLNSDADRNDEETSVVPTLVILALILMGWSLVIRRLGWENGRIGQWIRAYRPDLLVDPAEGTCLAGSTTSNTWSCRKVDLPA